jgi:hypothetical protein
MYTIVKSIHEIHRRHRHRQMQSQNRLIRAYGNRNCILIKENCYDIINKAHCISLQSNTFAENEYNKNTKKIFYIKRETKSKNHSIICQRKVHANSTWQIKCTSRANNNNNKTAVNSEHWLHIFVWINWHFMCLFFSSTFISSSSNPHNNSRYLHFLNAPRYKTLLWLDYPWDWCDTSIERIERLSGNCCHFDIQIADLRHLKKASWQFVQGMHNDDDDKLRFIYIIDMLFSQLDLLCCCCCCLYIFFSWTHLTQLTCEVSRQKN